MTKKMAVPVAAVMAIEDTEDDPTSISISASIIIAQVIVNWWIWSIWTWRFNRQTAFRGKNSENLLGEFKSYGYGIEVMKTVGFFKLSCATLIIMAVMVPGIPAFLYTSSGGLALLMLAAVVSHFKVEDPLVKNLPAATMLALNVYVLALSNYVMEASQSSDPLRFMTSDFGRFCIAAVMLTVDLLMWWRAYSTGVYKSVPRSRNIPFFNMVEGY